MSFADPEILVYLGARRTSASSHNLNARHHLALLALAALALPSRGLAQKQGRAEALQVDRRQGRRPLRRHVPPEYANRDRNVLNDQGVRVGFEEGEITRRGARREGSQGSRGRGRSGREGRGSATRPHAARDVSDRFRHRGFAQTAGSSCSSRRSRSRSSISANLRKRLVTLQDEASNYKPYTTREDAPQIPENLALDISRTARLDQPLRADAVADALRSRRRCAAAFDNDIHRFNELKGG